jgi:hypothetical protein
MNLSKDLKNLISIGNLINGGPMNFLYCYFLISGCGFIRFLASLIYFDRLYYFNEASHYIYIFKSFL